MTMHHPAPSVPAPGSGRPVGAVYADRGHSNLDILTALLSVVVILSGIGGGKAVDFGTIPGTGIHLLTDGAFFLFPLAYILGDIITELYGPRAARRAVLTGFVMSVLAVVVYWVVIALPGLDDDFGRAKQSALELAVGPLWQIVLAGVVAYLVGQFLNSTVLARMKERRGERGLIARLFTSSGLGEFVDTAIFCTIAAPVIGITTVGGWLTYTLLGFVWKVAVQYLAIPVTATVIRVLKRLDPSYQRRLAEQQGSGTPAPAATA
ncbi:queuosine precursor transporter [Brachybacterium sp. EF45031]|uniref:queuosine precursor transporter n=1 Tax=Brachybacterium sillae TaxID=2810536 RepID=UPI00217E9D0F|nr:queuosine precursor transporter [Brachybacterium sillae]MCS6710634.1 queuosine precursor transporter [Brachybacterium sillae]